MVRIEVLAAVSVGLLGACGSDGPPRRAPVYGMDERPVNPSCQALPRPRPSSTAVGALALVPAFPELALDEPVELVRQRLYPGDDTSWRWFVVEKGGRIRVFADARAGDAALVLDVSPYVRNESENGLLGLAFEPGYSADPSAARGRAYVYYTGGTDGGMHDCPPNQDGVRLCSFVSRFEITSTDGGRTLGAGGETILMRIHQPYDTHKAGQLAFGPDGYLYIALGDGGLAFDPHCAGQNLDTPLAKILRIDVRAGVEPYAIPADNPFAHVRDLCNDHRYRYAHALQVDNPDIARDEPCPETYAWGFRNPWRFSFDRATGALWAGDVGQDEREEVNLVLKGGNYGWNTLEGTLPLPEWAACSNRATAGLVPPAVEYSHRGMGAVTGGYVYRGSRLPSLFGSYVFTDSATGDVWAIDDPYALAGTLLDPPPVLDGNGAFVSMAEDEHGELYLVDLLGERGRSVLALVPGGEDHGPALPVELSATGCVQAGDPSRPAPGLIPYDVAAPLWSDGADKTRYLALPDGATLHVREDGDLELPVGSVLVKLFDRGGRRLETRLMVRHDDGEWGAYTYIWNDEQTEAYLADGRVERSFDGEPWTFPSRGDCLDCHTAAAGRALGPELAQLNRELDYPTGRRAHQIATLEHIGLFDAAVGDPASLDALPDPYAEGPVAARARAYLHANCSHCHRPGGALGAAMDLRYATPFAETSTCDERPVQGVTLGVADARLIAPGDPDRSLVYLRMLREDEQARMPPLGRQRVDHAAAALVREWIAEMSGCP